MTIVVPFADDCQFFGASNKSQVMLLGIGPIGTNNPPPLVRRKSANKPPPLLAAKIIYENTIFWPKSQFFSRLRRENEGSGQNRV